MLSIFSHVKWFTTDNPTQQPALSDSEWLFVAAVILAGLFVFRFVDSQLKKQKIEKRLDDSLKAFRPWVPLAVRVSTVLLLVVNFLQGYLLAPNVATNDTATSSLITVLFLISAALIGIGYKTKAGVIALFSGYLLVLTQADFLDVLDHFEYVGIAGYLWLRGPGIFSLSNYLAKGKLIAPELRNYSLDVYRISVGVGLATLGLTEKLANVTIAQDFLNQHSWNILSFAGVSDRWFIIIAGAVELLVGLALILNYAPRVLVTVVLGLMVTTAILLGIEEIYGHLFAVGIVVAIWVNDKKPAKRG